MRTLHGIDGLLQLPTGLVLSIGNFDGVHLGHQRILQTARALADERATSLAVATFEPHPMTVLRPGHAPPRLTLPHRKFELLEQAGVDELVILPPTQQVLDLSAEQFWAMLRDQVKPAAMVEGESFNFGKGRAGTVSILRQWAAAANLQLSIIPSQQAVLLNLSIITVSSSLIRWLIGHGRVRDACICLGRHFELEGKVIEGQKRGRTIGVPTANLHCDEQLIPADGVYAGRCALDGNTHAAAISIGHMPTFGTHARQIEVHLIDYSGDLYGRTIRVEFLSFLRDQRKFPSVELLKSQLARDICAAREMQGDSARIPGYTMA